MFWRRKTLEEKVPVTNAVTFEEAKQATRRAAFLNVAQKMTDDEDYQKGLSELFHACRSRAIMTGKQAGYTEAEIDDVIGELCDRDVEDLKGASDEKFKNFVYESGDIVTKFLAKL